MASTSLLPKDNYPKNHCLKPTLLPFPFDLVFTHGERARRTPPRQEDNGGSTVMERAREDPGLPFFLLRHTVLKVPSKKVTFWLFCLALALSRAAATIVAQKQAPAGVNAFLLGWIRGWMFFVKCWMFSSRARTMGARQKMVLSISASNPHTKKKRLREGSLVSPEWRG